MLLNKNIPTIGIVSLFIVSSVTPMVIGYPVKTYNKEQKVQEYTFNRYLYPEFYDCYNADEIPDFIEQPNNDISIDYENRESIVNTPEGPTQPLDGPMDSPWPMQGHDVRHTGRSPYSTSDNPGWEKWRFETQGWALSSPSIDKNGTIYFGSWHIYAVHPNGTLKWIYERENIELCCPAIDENGVIYAGAYSKLLAINPNGTLKWQYSGGAYIDASPAIDDDGIIYFVAGKSPPDGGHIFALYPNRTLKWKYPTNHVMYSSPAIGLDRTIYCGSHDEYIYALYPNGTLRWKYKTRGWVHGSPTIADDGTVYCGSDDDYLYAFYPNNGSVKWKINIGAIFGSPALDQDGTIYTGVWDNMFYAINPDGTIKWSFHTGAPVWGSSPALSDDNTLYFGTCDLGSSGGIEIIALYTDGTVKWRKRLDTVFSSPAIDKDGTVYIASSGPPGEGFLHAFGVTNFSGDADGPYYGIINRPVQFKGNAYKGVKPYEWLWDFDDGYTSEEQNPIHIYTDADQYTVTLTVTDNEGNISDNSSWVQVQATNKPPNKPTIRGFHYPLPNYPYNYHFLSTEPEENPIWYYVDWDDGTNSGWLGPYSPGKEITLQHAWPDEKVYIMKAKAKDIFDDESDWATFKINQPRNRATYNSLFLRLLEQFPILQKILCFIL
jgi:outer membrane protein assembly factor BamB